MDSTTYAATYNSADTASTSGGLSVVILLLVVLMIASRWRLFSKANKPGWAAIVPFYNTIVMLEIIGRPIWWFVVILFVPIFGWWLGIVTILDFAKAYGKSVGFGVLLVLVPFIGYPLLAFNKNTRYVGPVSEGLSGFTPAPDGGTATNPPVSPFVPQPPVASGQTTPASMPAQPLDSASMAPPAFAPVETTTPMTSGMINQPIAPVVPETPVTPVAPVVSDQPAAPGTAMQTPVDELVAANLPGVEGLLPVAAPPVVSNDAPVTPESPTAPNAPSAPTGDQGQPTPPQL